MLWDDGMQTSITEQKRIEAFLRRLALITEQGTEFIGFADTEFRGGFLNSAGRSLVGIPDDAPIESYRVIDFFAPEELERAQSAILPALKNDGCWAGETRLRHFVSGHAIPVHSNAFAVPDACGGSIGYACITTNLTRQKQAEAALRESEERFRGIFEHAGTGIAIVDMQGQFQCCNPAFSALLGYSENELLGLQFAKLVHPEDRETNLIKFHRLVAEKIPSYEVVNRYVGKICGPLWVHKQVSLLRNAAGRPTNIIALVTDITERKQREEQVQLLMREVNHRSKNMLTLVQAVARQTVASDPDDFLERFGERVQAMAASQDLLVKSEWKGVELGELVRSQLAHFKDLIGSRIELAGPPLTISAPAAQPIGMALHELATNAGKYGALANGSGRISIAWSVKSTDGKKPVFTMIWRERGGAPVKAPARQGFGTAVMCEMAEMSLSAAVGLDFKAAGLTWRLRCPAKEVLDESQSSRPSRSAAAPPAS